MVVVGQIMPIHIQTHTQTHIRMYTPQPPPSDPHFFLSNGHIIGNEVIAREGADNAGVSAIFYVQKWLLRELKFWSTHDPVGRTAVGGKTNEHIQNRQALDGSIPGCETDERNEMEGEREE